MQLGPGRGWGRLGTPQLCLGVEVMRASPAEPKSGQSTHGWGLFRAKMPFAWSFPTGGGCKLPTPQAGRGALGAVTYPVLRDGAGTGAIPAAPCATFMSLGTAGLGSAFEVAFP